MIERIDPSLLSRINDRRVMETVQARGPSSRAEVTRHSGISAPTVSKSVGSLLESGLLEEGDGPRRALGRPGRLLSLASRSSRVAGLVLDAACCTLVTAGLDGGVHESEEFATPRRYGALLEAVVSRVRRRNGVRLLGLGISLPGLVDARSGRGLLSPNLHLTDGQTPASDLSERLGIPTVALQEADALCLAEWNFGSARGLQDFALLDATTGLGLGVVSGGRLLDGARGLAGELGHVVVDPSGARCGCGNRGCLETRLRGASSVDALAMAIGTAVNLFNPQAVFVHARLLSERPQLWERLRRALPRFALGPPLAGCRVEPARGTKPQGAVAAIVGHLLERLGPCLR